MSDEKMHLNDVRGREDWFLGLITRGVDTWLVPVWRYRDRLSFTFTMPAPFSFAEVHEEAVRQIEAWENTIMLVVPRQNAKLVHASRSGGRITRCNITFSTAQVVPGRVDEVTCPRCAQKVQKDG